MSGPNGKLTEEQVKAEMARLAAGRNGLGPAKNANGQVHDLTTHRQGAAGGSETAAQGANGATGASAAGQEWPTLGQVAFHGLAGRVVRTLDPHTEADPAGLLICFLAAFGNIVGAGPHASADASKHPARLNVLLVGKTAKARKGTAWANIVRPMALADPGWAMECMVSGLSSGEGLIAEVRDPGEDQLAGVPDKRRLVVEAEFARVLNMTARDGNILSAVIRDAWDHGRLRTMTRFDPLRATGAHISILGQIIAEELVRKLSDVESANGFANRFLFCCVRRSKYLPDGGRLDRDELEGLADLVGRAGWSASERTRSCYDAAMRSVPALRRHGVALVALVGVLAVVTAGCGGSRDGDQTAGMMQAGPGMVGYAPRDSGEPVRGLAAARRQANRFGEALGLHAGEVMQFANGFYAELLDADANRATEVLVDPRSGSVWSTARR